MLFASSCAMTGKESGKRGRIIGAVAGGVGGYFLGQKHGRTKTDRIKGALIGGTAGAGVGNSIGEKSSTLKGIEDVIVR